MYQKDPGFNKIPVRADYHDMEMQKSRDSCVQRATSGCLKKYALKNPDIFVYVYLSRRIALKQMSISTIYLNFWPLFLCLFLPNALSKALKSRKAVGWNLV